MNSTDVCVTCGGSGWYFGPDDRERTCACEELRRLRLCLARHGLSGVKPLYKAEIARANGHRLVRGSWEVVKQHAAGWLANAYLKDSTVTIALADDVTLRNMWLGKKGGARQEGASLLRDDFERPALVVVRLRHVKHAGTACALAELLDISPQVWLAETSGRDFEKGHPSWPAELAETMRDVGMTHHDLGGVDSAELDDLMGGSK